MDFIGIPGVGADQQYDARFPQLGELSRQLRPTAWRHLEVRQALRVPLGSMCAKYF
jgi:hypothetical protein